MEPCRNVWQKFKSGQGGVGGGGCGCGVCGKCGANKQRTSTMKAGRRTKVRYACRPYTTAVEGAHVNRRVLGVSTTAEWCSRR